MLTGINVKTLLLDLLIRILKKSNKQAKSKKRILILHGKPKTI